MLKFIAAISLFLGLSIANNALAQSVICASDPVPAGYVYTSSQPASYCPTGFGYRIDPASDNLYVCVTSPVPDPFVIIGNPNSNNGVCGNVGQKLITSARPGLYICSNSPIASGYVITMNTTSQGSCPVGQFVIDQARNGLVACSNSPIPSPYIVSTISRTGNCGSLWTGWTLTSAYDGVRACANSTIPAGYVVTSIEPHAGVCGGDISIYRLALPQPNMLACLNSPIPEGWRKLSEVAVSNCEPYKRAFYLGRFLM
ncbi:hypothetical protein [Xanthomonas cannabis]|uniref:hypothetical protein n=1 Tax=Xanthomonas cannabis TaxID=1885674 RepID=UPI00141B74A1|nr:hypothetical protein [Xanthomonas cannabis]NIK18660.1 hypothetical protein [Xanthomonas cannabis]